MMHGQNHIKFVGASLNVTTSDENIFSLCVASNNISASSQLSHNINDDKKRHNS